MTESTWLFVPGSSPQRFAKATAAGAGAVIIDLEDAVDPADKETARQAVAGWLDEGRAWVRVNAAGTPWFADDVAALRGRPGLLGVVLSKAEDPRVVTDLAHDLDRPVLPLVESAAGVVRAAELAAAPGVRALAFGSLDYALDLGADHVDDVLLTARNALVLASRVAGIEAPVDGVTTALDDPELAEADATRSRSLGFGGKLCIHPRQLEPVERGFRPPAEQVAWARAIVETAGDSSEAVRGPDGAMIDRPVLERARQTLRRAGVSARTEDGANG